jgi:hypothetical protein
MLWLTVIAGGIGTLLGLWLRIYAVIAVSCVIVLASAVLIALLPWPLLQTAALTFALLAVLQCGYLAGCLLSSVWTRASSVQRTADLPS